MPVQRRNLLLGLLGAAGLATVLPLAAAPDQPPVNTLAGQRLAIHGYDPVAYFVEGGPRRGRAEFVAEHAGAVWRFASEANRQRFTADPARYTPVYGGYCAYGVAQGYLVKIDPEAWTIHDGRLYLNYDKSVRATWLKDVTGYVASSERNWSRLFSGQTVARALSAAPN